MELQVNQDLCRGCGMCADVCDTGAIQVAAQKAWIEASLCIQCQTCVDACPNGAISAAPVPLLEPMAGSQPVTDYSLVPARRSDSPAVPKSAQTWAALTRLGQVALPYVLDGIALLLEWRQASQSANAQTFLPGQTASFRQARSGGSGPAQRRRRARKGRHY